MITQLTGVVLTLLISASSAVPQQAELTPADRKVFAWFDALGYAGNLRDPVLVLVSSGRWSEASGDPVKHAERFFAFLLEERGSQFRVLTLTLQERTYVRSAAHEGNMEVKFEPADLEQVVARSLAAGRTEADFSRVVNIPGLWQEQLAYTVMARVCAARRLDRQAHDLLQIARAADLGEPLPRDFLADVGDSIATYQYHQALIDLEANAPRASVRDRLRRLARNFPKASFAEDARKYSAILDRMIREDTEHARRSVSAITADRQAQVRELVFQLRNEVGFQISSPGGVYFLTNELFGMTVTRHGAAQQLADIGYEAVPALIEALASPALTRTYYRRNGPRSIVAVRDALVEILEAISGLDFTVKRQKGEWDLPTTKRAASAWWRELSLKGERQTLIDGTGAGHAGQAMILVKKYPKDAAQVLTRALAGTQDEYVHRCLMRAATELRSGDELPILRSGLQDADPDTQLMAAEALVGRGFEEEVVGSVLKTWMSVKDLDSRWPEFLVRLPDPRAIEALSFGWRGRSYGTRAEIIDALRGDQIPPSNLARAEGTLALALDDCTATPPMSGYFRSGLINNPRICDMAANAMAEHWSKKYQFNGLAPVGDRDAQILVIKRMWRGR